MPDSLPEFNFTPQSHDTWRNAAKQELDGADPFEKLSVEKENLRIYPYYDSIQSFHESDFQSPPSVNPYFGARAWANVPKVVVESEKQANALMLEHLNNGGDGLLLEIKNSDADMDSLFERIELPFCSISFSPDTDRSFLNRFHQFVEKKFDVKKITGAIFHSSHPFDRKFFNDWSGYHSLGIACPSDKATDQIAEGLSMAINKLEQSGLGMEFVPRVSFLIDSSTDFFLDIARIKAIKHMWWVVANAYKVKLISPTPVHVQSAAWINKNYEPHGNLLKQTTSGLAAVMGGADAITLEAENTSEMPIRIARNISSILREESHLSRVADPVSGSYYLRSLTNQLITDSWKKFQAKVS